MDGVQTFELGGEDTTYAVEEETSGQAQVAEDAFQQLAKTPLEPMHTRRRKPQELPEYSGSDAARHQQLVLMASRFGESAVLSGYLSSLGFKLSASQIKTQTIEDLEAMIERIKVSVVNKGGNSFVTKAFFSCTKAAEVIVSKNIPSCPLHGLTDALSKDPVCADLLELVSITRNVGCSSPEMQIGLCIASTISRVVMINKYLQARAQQPPDETEDENKSNPVATTTETEPCQTQ